MGTYFLAGIYGVGKSTLGFKLSEKLNLPFFSSGDLISQVNGETYGANKAVADKDKNQNILAVRVSELLADTESILLAGHFCIVNRESNVEDLPEDIFDKLNISKIILLEADVDRIANHLQKRDSKSYTRSTIECLAKREHELAVSTATRLGCSLIIHHMDYSDTDISSIMEVL